MRGFHPATCSRRSKPGSSLSLEIPHDQVLAEPLQLRFALYFWQEAFKRLHPFFFFPPPPLFLLLFKGQLRCCRSTSPTSEPPRSSQLPGRGGEWQRRFLKGRRDPPRGLRSAPLPPAPPPLQGRSSRAPCPTGANRGYFEGSPLPPPLPVLLLQAPANESDPGNRGRGRQIWGNSENPTFGAEEWQT